MVSGPSTLRHIGRYEVIEELGRGAMGVVFKARDPFIGRSVPVKTITAGIAENADLMERFLREAMAAGGLQHPNIVTIYGMSDLDGLPFIAMEYLEGESLEKLIGRQMPAPVASSSESEVASEPSPTPFPDTTQALDVAPAPAAVATPPAAPASVRVPRVPAAQPVSSSSAHDAVTPASVSLEDQQRRLIDLAHEAADARDYKAAQSKLDEAGRLNGPLNSLIDNLRRQFSVQAHGAELQQAARTEQTLWDQAMKNVAEDHLDDADKALREILTLPEGGHHLADAERYVDQVIPQQRHQDGLWAQAQAQSSSNEPGHLLNAIKTLDQILAGGGIHEQDANQMRDSVMKQFARGAARRNHETLESVPIADQAKFLQLEGQFFDFVKRGDAQGLEQLQALRAQFKTIADSGGPLAADARDYLNSLIPKAQKEIEDRLANAESAATANAAYETAVKQYDQTVATLNTNMLRSRVLPEFQQIAGSDSPRAPEAQRYVSTLIPAALKAADTH